MKNVYIVMMVESDSDGYSRYLIDSLYEKEEDAQAERNRLQNQSEQSGQAGYFESYVVHTYSIQSSKD